MPTDFSRQVLRRGPWMVAALLTLPALAMAQEETRALAKPILGPTVINQPGSYIVFKNITLHTPGTAIRIVASNVSLDLNGHTLAGPGGKQGTGVSIVGVGGVRVHNGIVSRFGTGIEVSGSSNVRVEGLQISGEDAGGPPPGEVGILLRNSRAVVLERNQIAANVVAGGQNGQLGICYNPDGAADPDGPTGDLVYNNLVSRFQTGIQTSAGTSGNVFRENDLAFVQQGIQEVTPGSNVFADNTEVQIGL
jgi:hypothetical protein